MKPKRPHQRIALAFILIGSLLGYQAVSVCWLWAWPAFNCLWVGCAYFGIGGQVFGKREDGTMMSEAVLLLLPFLLVTWATWYVQNFFSSESATNEVAPGLWVGRRVFSHELPPSVTLVVDMTSEFSNPGYEKHVEYLTIPTLDAFVPSKARFVAGAEAAAKHEGGVLIYCANGHGRSTAMMAAVLMKKNLVKSVAEAERLVVLARPLAAWHPAQRALLEALAA